MSTDAVEAIRQLLTIDDLMKRWQVSRGTIENEVRRKRLKKIRIAGLVRFQPEEVERYEKEG